MIYKCKMCGGSLNINDGETIAVCEYCESKQTLPRTNDDVTGNLFNRANNLRLKCEFDKASQIYEKIIEQDDSEAEAHWCNVLCKYGIEYIEDPTTSKRIPTCHRTLFEPVTTDPDYLAAIDYSDSNQQVIYENEARAIDRIQKDILNIVKNEKPFDVFICYKETDENGKRTQDSVLANDIYYELTKQSFKVFYAAITLEDKLGQDYEPYIFAALNSAKVMLCIGTKPEYFNAVWEKNEWSRFMKLMKTDRSKLLIPCYRDMDAYDLPEEFSHLQAQDMSKIGFITDITRGIKKIINNNVDNENLLINDKNTLNDDKNTINIAALVKRIEIFIEDHNWKEADTYCERVLDEDPENGIIYFYKLLISLEIEDYTELSNINYNFSDDKNFKRAIKYLEKNSKEEYDVIYQFIKQIENENTQVYQSDKNYDDMNDEFDNNSVEVECPFCKKKLTYLNSDLEYGMELDCPYCVNSFIYKKER